MILKNLAQHACVKLIHAVDLTVIPYRYVQVFQITIRDVIDQAVQVQELSPGPGILYDGGFRQVVYLLMHVQFNQSVGFCLLVFYSFQLLFVQAVYVFDVTQPVINKAYLLLHRNRSVHTR